uniref:histidine kinase n=1 Tax=Streptomyces hygroscopicus subsp. yingchengensis TaxID=228732 RepID=Q83YE7_STRHY|nr:CvhA [Streptomyces hygroscopicus subsp. yingchengensis]
MPIPARSRQRRGAGGAAPASPYALPVILAVTAAGAATAAVLAPEDGRRWVWGTVVVAWICIAAVVSRASVLVRRAHRRAAEQGNELELARNAWRHQSAETSRLVDVILPDVIDQVRNGTGVEEALSTVTLPSDPHLQRLLRVVATELATSVGRALEAESGLEDVRAQLERDTAELRRVAEETLPAAIALLREGSSADTVLAKFDWPHNVLLRSSAERFVRELAYSERRSAAAQAASAKALSRVQAKTVSMLADLREMQERHGEEVFGDLLRLDHSTSQLGLMTDRLALLMGGRSSRVWNKPIVMESILRGAVGRIAAYRRVRLHSSSRAAISAFAAEGVMHLLAELMDNAANFSPPIDEVHVYVEERSAGLVVTIEDSGLKMSDAAMRRAVESVSGRVTDLASLQGTRLGLGVVGRLAVKYGISVSYRPSSRGGTGVVVLIPPQLVAQRHEPLPTERPRQAAPAPHSPARPADEPRLTLPEPAARTAPPPASPAPAPATSDVTAGRGGATANGLPVRAPGRAMAEAERTRRKPAAQTPADPRVPGPALDAGSRFGAFHRGRRRAEGASADGDTHDTVPDA